MAAGFNYPVSRHRRRHGPQGWPKTSMTVKSTKPWSDHGVAFEYEFEVDGTTYTGSGKSREVAITPVTQAEVARKYAKGSRHDVYYKPDAPGDYSVLKPGGNAMMQLVGIILASLAVAGLGFNIRLHFRAIFYGHFDESA